MRTSGLDTFIPFSVILKHREKQESWDAVGGGDRQRLQGGSKVNWFEKKKSKVSLLNPQTYQENDGLLSGVSK